MCNQSKDDELHCTCFPVGLSGSGMWTRKVRRKDDTRELGSNHRLSSVRQKTKVAVDGFKCTLHLSPPAPSPPSPLPSPQSPSARAAHVERSGISFFGPLPRLARPVAKNKASLRRKRGRYQGETRLAVVQPTEGGNEGEAVQIAREGGGGRRGGGVAWQSGPSRRK